MVRDDSKQRSLFGAFLAGFNGGNGTANQGPRRSFAVPPRKPGAAPPKRPCTCTGKRRIGG